MFCATELKAQEWIKLVAEPEFEKKNNCYGSAKRLLAKANDIEKKLEAAGFSILQLLKPEQRRFRKLEET